MNIRLFGLDNRGKVYDAGNSIRRIVNQDYAAMARKLYAVFAHENLESKGIVKTYPDGKNSFVHEKFTISYPFEWPANMFKDALLTHIRLFSELDRHQLTLKDGLPNNIVFKNTEPVFVDFLSLVFINDLKEEDWLNSKNYRDPRFAVLQSMLMPFFVLPLLYIGRGHFGVAKALLSCRSCNCCNHTPLWRNLVAITVNGVSAPLLQYFKSIYIWLRLNTTLYVMKRKTEGFNRFIEVLGQIIEDYQVTPKPGAYLSYYREKKENHSLTQISNYSEKQKSVYHILKMKSPKTVLDIGANTGWYSVLAGKLGAKVISIEIDQSCSDYIYRNAKSKGLAILPLCMSFDDLNTEFFAVGDENTVVYDGFAQRIPLYRRGTDRLQSDLVLILGLAHHLVLGEGYSIAAMFEILAKLAKQTLVLEFVDLHDEKIINEPSFFRHLHKHDSGTYNIDNFILAAKKYFPTVQSYKSNPDSRSILVFSK